MNNLLLETLEEVGVKRAHVRHDGRDKTRVTVKLAWSSLGHLLRIMFIFKGVPESDQSLRKLAPLIEKFGHRATFALASSATANTNTTRQFMHDCVDPYIRQHQLKYPIIFYDAFPGHGYNTHTGEYNPQLENYVNKLGVTGFPPQVPFFLLYFYNHILIIVFRCAGSRLVTLTFSNSTTSSPIGH